MAFFSRTEVGNYAIAVMLVAIATVLQAIAIRFGGANVPLVVYYPLLAWATWATSMRFGLLATAASVALVWILFLSNSAVYTSTLPERLIHLGTFAALGALACGLGALARQMRVRTRAQRNRETAEHERDEAMLEANRMLRAIVDASPDAIVGVAADRRIVSWNPAAQDLFGYDERDALGRDAATLVAPRWRRRHPVPDTLDEIRDPIGPVDMLFVGREGRRFRATASASRVSDDPHGQVSLSIALRDSDEQRTRDRRVHRSLRGARNARRQADTSNRLKDELLATVSHELRTPLNVIYGWVEVLRNSGDHALQRQAIDAIDRSARSLSRMVGDILDASSLATGKLRIDSMPVDLVRIVADVTDSFRSATAATDGVELVRECSLDACIVSGDGERLRQMLANLLSNAFKFTPSGGRVTVGLARVGDEVRLTVADTGQGIPSEFLPHVFEAFRRANDSPASTRRGLGLGLSIVRHIAELHGGAVAARSAGPNRGTVFTVTLPAGWHPVGALAWAGRLQDGGGDAPALDSRRILLVDDDATTRESLSAALATLGAQVSVASSGREALAMVDDVRPDVVLSDLAMSDGDGFWLLGELRRREPRHDGLRVLAVTAHAGRTDERQVLDAGFDGYLCKPIDVKALAQAIVRTTSE